MPEKRRMYDPEFRDGAVQRAMSQCYGRKPTRLPDHIRTSAESTRCQGRSTSRANSQGFGETVTQITPVDLGPRDTDSVASHNTGSPASPKQDGNQTPAVSRGRTPPRLDRMLRASGLATEVADQRERGDSLSAFPG